MYARVGLLAAAIVRQLPKVPRYLPYGRVVPQLHFELHHNIRRYRLVTTTIPYAFKQFMVIAQSRKFITGANKTPLA